MIGAGHSLTEIRTYTLAQASMFIDAIGRARRLSRLERLADLRASQLDQKGFQKHLKDLE